MLCRIPLTNAESGAATKPCVTRNSPFLGRRYYGFAERTRPAVVASRGSPCIRREVVDYGHVLSSFWLRVSDLVPSGADLG